jgi:hypothetical protein
MLTSVVLKGEFGAPTFTLKREGASPSDRYILKGIDGLGPPDLTPRIGNQFYDGGHYQGRRSEPRNLVMRIGLRPNYALNETVDQLRDALYASLVEGSDGDIWTMESQGLITVEAHDSVKSPRVVTGIIDKFETAYFSNEPDVQISILCPDPYWRDPDLQVLPLSGYIANIDYTGTKSVGFFTTILLNGEASSVRFTFDFDYTFRVTDSTTPFQAGDRIYIKSSLPSSFDQSEQGLESSPGPYVLKQPAASGQLFNIMDRVTRTSVWPKLKPGDNTIQITYEEDPPNYTFEKISYYITDCGV